MINFEFDNYIVNLFCFYYYEFNYIDVSIWILLPEILLLTFSFLILLTNYLFNTKVYYFWILGLFITLLFYYTYVIMFSKFSSNLLDFLLENFIIFDYYYLFFKTMIIALSLIILILAWEIINNTYSVILNEFFFLFLMSIFFMLILISSSDFYSCYLSLEGMSFSLYLLSASSYYNRLSIEASLKYFILGSVASSILLYGISFSLIVTTSLDFFSIKYFLLFSLNSKHYLDIMLIIFLLTIGLFFKLSIFPCHMWTLDVYEGIWIPCTAFFALVVKLTLFIFTIRIFCYVFSSIFIWRLFFIVGGCGSIIVGCLGAMIQKRIKRFLAYTSINQIGFLLIGLTTNNIFGISSCLLFLLVYLIMNIIFFGIILNTKHFTQNFQIIFLNDLYSLNGNEVYIDLIWVLTLFSMAGIPPLAGFFSKYYILLNLTSLSFYYTVFLILIFSTISSYYYLNFIKCIFFEKKQLKTLYFFDAKVFELKFLIILFASLILVFFIFLIPVIFDKLIILSFSCKYILQ